MPNEEMSPQGMGDLPPFFPPEPVEEEHFGVRVVDPYRYLEDGQSPRTRAFEDAQNRYTRSLLDRLPAQEREALRRDLEAGLRVDRASVPVVRGQRLFYARRLAQEEQAVLLVREGEEERVLVDPHREGERGLTTLDWYHVSPDGSLVAYGLSSRGDEWSTLFLLRVDTGQRLPVAIPRTRYASVAFLPGGEAFFYTRYPAVGEVPPGLENYGQHVRLCRLGRPPAEDPVVFSPSDPRHGVTVHVTEDGRFLLLEVRRGWGATDLYLAPCDPATGELHAPPRLLTQGLDALFHVELDGSTLYVRTNWEAPRFRLLRLSLHAALEPGPLPWEEVVPEPEQATLAGFALVQGGVAVQLLRDAVGEVYLYHRDGTRRAQAQLPPLGSVTALSGGPRSPYAYALYESFLVPARVYRIHGEDGTAHVWWAPSQPDASPLGEVQQVFYASRDGTRVPMFLVVPAGAHPDGQRPTVLTGYGGFGLSRTPAYEPELLAWLRRGGVWALACLRGGGEYGEAWHAQGRREHKQNVFDDFLAAADYLVRTGWTNPDRLAVTGRSNGGLLVGAALTQAPQAMRAVWCGVPLLDMLRFHRFLIGDLWTDEYGSPDDPQAFRWLWAYSPYHHVKPGVRYPAVLFTTARQDSRVDPMHARKMAARMQAANPDPQGRPVLLRVEDDAGHGVGRPLWKVLDELVDAWSFLAWQLGVWKV